jgi:hypothetical protein
MHWTVTYGTGSKDISESLLTYSASNVSILYYYLFVQMKHII